MAHCSSNKFTKHKKVQVALVIYLPVSPGGALSMFSTLLHQNYQFLLCLSMFFTLCRSTLAVFVVPVSVLRYLCLTFDGLAVSGHCFPRYINLYIYIHCQAVLILFCTMS